MTLLPGSAPQHDVDARQRPPPFWAAPCQKLPVVPIPSPVRLDEGRSSAAVRRFPRLGAAPPSGPASEEPAAGTVQVRKDAVDDDRHSEGGEHERAQD